MQTMKTKMKRKLTTVMVLVFWLAISSLATAADPLPSWAEGVAKQSVFDFASCKMKSAGNPACTSERIFVGWIGVRKLSRNFCPVCGE